MNEILLYLSASDSIPYLVYQYFPSWWEKTMCYTAIRGIKNSEAGRTPFATQILNTYPHGKDCWLLRVNLIQNCAPIISQIVLGSNFK